MSDRDRLIELIEQAKEKAKGTLAIRFLVYMLVAFSIWLISLIAYTLILEPETFTWYENFMSAIVGAFVSREICHMAFKGGDNNG